MLYEIIYGGQARPGLFEWIEDEIIRRYSGTRFVRVYINSIGEADELRQGDFPSVQIYPSGDKLIRKDGYVEHETTVRLIVTFKGPRDKTFSDCIEFACSLYDHFMTVVPLNDYVNEIPINGEVVFSWEGFRTTKHRNMNLTHSAVDLVYRWRYPCHT